MNDKEPTVLELIKKRLPEAQAGIAAWLSAPIYPPNVLLNDRLSAQELEERGLAPDYYSVKRYAKGGKL